MNSGMGQVRGNLTGHEYQFRTSNRIKIAQVGKWTSYSITKRVNCEEFHISAWNSTIGSCFFILLLRNVSKNMLWKQYIRKSQLTFIEFARNFDSFLKEFHFKPIRMPQFEPNFMLNLARNIISLFVQTQFSTVKIYTRTWTERAGCAVQ